MFAVWLSRSAFAAFAQPSFMFPSLAFQTDPSAAVQRPFIFAGCIALILPAAWPAARQRCMYRHAGRFEG